MKTLPWILAFSLIAISCIPSYFALAQTPARPLEQQLIDSVAASKAALAALEARVIAAQAVPVRNEVPLAVVSGWSLIHPPRAGATCFRNGLRQAPGLDYVLTGTLIASDFWRTGDALACDYEW